MSNLSAMKPPRRLCLSYCLLPQRYLTAILLFFGMLNLTLLRVSFNTIHRHILHKHTDGAVSSVCPPITFNETVLPAHTTQEVNWPEHAADDVEAAFLYGYLIGQLPAGYLSDRYGGKYVLGAPAAALGPLSMLTPTLILQTGSHYPVMALRALLGLLIAGMLPAVTSLLSSWAPARERCTLTAIVYCALPLGTVVNNLLTTRVIRLWWPYVFHLYGLTTVAWSVCWMLLGYSNPERCPFIRDEEMHYLRKLLRDHVTYGKKRFPFKDMFSTISLWALMVIFLGHSWLWDSMYQQMTFYMKMIIGVDVSNQYNLMFRPYVAMAISTLCMGYLSDVIVRRNVMGLEAARKISTILGAVGPGIFIMGATFSGCSATLAMAMFGIGMSLLSFFNSGTLVVFMDLSPNYSGFIMGFANTLASVVTCTVQSNLLLKFVKKNELDEWRKLFLISLLLLMFGTVIFTIFGTTREQKWNREKLHKEQDVTF